MRTYSFQISTEYSSTLGQQPTERPTNRDRTAFDRIKSEFKGLMLPPFGRRPSVFGQFAMGRI